MSEKIEQGTKLINTATLINAVEELLIDKGMEATQRLLTSEGIACAFPSNSSNVTVNVIPNESIEKVMCCNLLIAIAHGSRGIGGLCQVMQQLREHLICCADAKHGISTKTAIIIYDKEDKRVFWESKRDFIAHMICNGVNFVRLYWNGKKLIEMAVM
jgi:hypothetical protein